MDIIEFKPKGVCAKKITIKIQYELIKEIIIEGSCPAYGEALNNILYNRDIYFVIQKLKGIICKTRETSCPDQIAKALKKYSKTINLR